jgi:uncharacterized protein (DUF983 family)
MLNYILSVLQNRCPRCREGHLFESKNPYDLKKTAKMHKNCPACKQPTEIEVGFYYGTSYVSYALTVAFSAATCIAWKLLIGMTFSIDDNRIFYWFICNAVLMLLLQPVFIRLSRSLWLSWFVKYDPKWKEHPLDNFERVVPEQMNNW